MSDIKGYRNRFAEFDGDPHWIVHALETRTSITDLAARYAIGLADREANRQKLSRFDSALLNLTTEAHRLRQGTGSEDELITLAYRLIESVRSPFDIQIIDEIDDDDPYSLGDDPDPVLDDNGLFER